MDTLLYLTELLQTSKTIGIAGLGTLYKKKSPGKYDAEKHAFVPPTFTLAFTSDVKEQEELANYISQKRNISISAANYYINEFAESIQNQLAEEKEASLGSIGKLQLVNDEIILIPAEKDSYGFDFYGLPELTDINAQPKTDIVEKDKQVTLAEITEENKLEEENPGQETEDSIEENVLANDDQEVFEEITEIEEPVKTYHQLNENASSIETSENEVILEEKVKNTTIDSATILPTAENVEIYEEEIEEQPKKGMPFFLKFLIAFLIIVALGAIIYFINPTLFNNYFNQNFSGNKQLEKPVATNDSLATMNDTLQQDTLAKNNELVTLQKDTVAKIDSTKITVFEVLVSAVATDKKADKIIENLSHQGVKAKKIRLSRTMINISAGSFLTEYGAKLYRDSLRLALKNQGIYIQPIKPKN